jgi:hypothetical protein
MAAYFSVVSAAVCNAANLTERDIEGIANITVTAWLSLMLEPIAVANLPYGARRIRVRDFLASTVPNLRLSATEERRVSPIDGSAQSRKRS